VPQITPQPPQLPPAGELYSSAYHNQLNNILRLYLNAVTSSISALARDAAVIAVQSGGTLTDAHRFVTVDPAGGAAVINLPPAAGYKEFVITMTGTGTLTITPDGADTIIGAASLVISAQWTSKHLKADDGGNWLVV